MLSSEQPPSEKPRKSEINPDARPMRPSCHPPGWDKPSDQPVSRRDLLAVAGVGAMFGTIPAGSVGAASSGQPATGTTGAAQSAGGTAIEGCGGRMSEQKQLQADVVIVGGGMAGTCAAIAAAREGASVILVQDRPVLGGNASSEIRMHIVGADGGQGGKIEARETGIIEELRLEDAVHNPQRCANMWDLLLLDKVKAEPNITLLFNTHCFAVEMAGADRIAAIHASRPSTEDTFIITGRLFLDCSGDGRLGAEAGAEARVGREGRAEFDESLAPRQGDHRVLGSSILFITRKHDRSMPFVPPTWIRKFPDCSDLPHRGHNAWEYGFWWVEWGGERDIIKDDPQIRDELLAVALGVWDHIKNSGKHPQSENWALDWLGFLSGKRESRRFVGDYMLRQSDLERGAVFSDGVAYGGWPLDLHPPEGIDTREKPNIAERVPLYNIPLRCLYSRNIRNLMFAGRNISASHVAFGSTRVMATCSVMGQAVGTAAAMCVRKGCDPREVATAAAVELQQRLLRNDAYIVGASNADTEDLARTASVGASSETSEGPALSVTNGVQRGTKDSTNRWISDPGMALPQWIELRFDSPRQVREVHLVFDTGLTRRLALSHNDHFTATMIRGPQPESVRDYELLTIDGDQQHSLIKVEGNYQRKRVHTFEPVTTAGLRLVVNATNGDASARVFEIRTYS